MFLFLLNLKVVICMDKQKCWVIRVFTGCYCFYMFYFASDFQFMALNVFLAYLPIEISFHRKQGKFFYLTSFLWLLFYPNAPYLLTDFFHLEVLSIYQKNSQIFSSSLQDWWAFCLLVVGIVPYYFWGVQSMFSVIMEWKRSSSILKNTSSIFLIGGIHLLASLAIYVGRFQRLHSIYLFTRPIETIQFIFFEWTVNKLVFIAMFTALQSVLLFLVFGRKIEKGEKLY